MKSAIAIPSLVLVLTGTMLGGIALAEQKLTLEGSCTLTHEASVLAEGPCTVLQKDAIVTIGGTMGEKGEKYTVVINNSKDTGTLISGTLTLADGKLEKNELQEVRWPNDYVLKLEVE